MLLLTVRANSRLRSIRGEAPKIRTPSGAEDENRWNTNLFRRKRLKVSFQLKKLMPAPNGKTGDLHSARHGTQHPARPLTTANYNFTSLCCKSDAL